MHADIERSKERKGEIQDAQSNERERPTVQKTRLLCEENIVEKEVAVHEE